jgi:hypothetical protein
MVAIARNKIQPFKSSLNILDSAVDGLGTSQTGPSSFEGFDVKTDKNIRRQAKKSWFDLRDDSSSAATTPFVTPSPFECPSVPHFPVSGKDGADESPKATIQGSAAPVWEEPDVPQRVHCAAPRVFQPATSTNRPVHGRGFQHHSNHTQPPLQIPKANFELEGYLPFFPFDDLAIQGELPSKDILGVDPARCPKLFLGHLWSRVPTGVIQFLLNKFAPEGSVAFGPQLHFNKEGWFRGCLHVSVITSDVQHLIYSLHKRVLFDHHGVWFAETPEQMRVLDEYCRRLRSMPLHVRHNKLQSLPCNPLACEIAMNEQ